MVNVKITETKIGLAKHKEKNYYGTSISQGSIDSHSFLKEVSEKYRIPQADLLRVIIAIADSIPYYLKQGKIVNTKELGSFQLSVKTEVVSEPKLLKPSKVKSYKIIYKPGNWMTDQLYNIDYKIIVKKISKRKEETMT